MTLGENIHNAFLVVFKTLKSIEKLISRCRNEFDMEKYHMPEKRFMRWSSDQSKVYVAQMDFGDISDWSAGCSPSNHSMFYDAIHADGWYEADESEDVITVRPAPGFEEKVSGHFWGFQSLRRMEKELTEINQDNYKTMIFGTIEELAGGGEDMA